MFQTSLINHSYYSYLLSMSFVMNVANIYHPYVVILVPWELDHLFLSSLIILIHVHSIHALVILILLHFSDFYHQHQSFLVWSLSCHFWWMICFSSLKSLSSESRDEILFRGEGCDNLCTWKLGTLSVSVKYVFVSVQLVYVYVKLLKI
jgi:hypothetical protein